MAGRKFTEVAIRQRVNEVMSLLVSGMPRSAIISTITAKYDIGDDQVKKDLQAACKLIQEDHLLDPSTEIALSSAQYKINIDLARSTGQIAAANQAQFYMDKIKGLHKPEIAVQVNNNSVNLSNISVDDLERLLKAANTNQQPETNDNGITTIDITPTDIQTVDDSCEDGVETE